MKFVVATLAVVLLAGCGSIHPGAAAVVDGSVITMETADETATAYCAVATMSTAQQGGGAVSAAESRRQAVTDLVTREVAQRVADDRGVSPDPALFQLGTEQKTEIRETFADSNPDNVVEVIVGAQTTFALIVAIGEDETGLTLNDDNGQEIQAAGQEVVAEAMQQIDVSIDDRFGIDDTTAQISETGSLSVSEEALAQVPPSELPATQRCS